MTPCLNSLTTDLFDGLNFINNQELFIAYSGGLDSTVLLQLAADRCRHSGGKLTALHVNHGISKHSAIWQAHCQRFCDQLGIELLTKSLKLERDDEHSARKARYQWFAQIVPRGAVLMTAHHQNDRAETLLFNLLRGAGSAGLSSLRGQRPFYGATLVRPLLAISKSDIIDYAQRRKLDWVEDESNTDTRYSRNYIRHKVLPVMQELRDDAARNICRAASNLEQENGLLREIAISDLVEVREFPEHPLDGSRAICFGDMQGLSTARQANLLRFWLGSLNLHIPSKSLLSSLLAAFTNPPVASAVIQEDGVQYRFFKNYLYVMPAQSQPQEFETIQWSDIELPLNLFHHKIRIGATNKLRDFWNRNQPSQLKLVARPQVVNPKAIQGHSLDMKKWMQQNNIPPWRRQVQPLLTLNQNNTDVILTAVDQDIHTEWVSLECPLAG